MKDITRRYDIDWLRVIAIGLLLVYHVAIGFQPWGAMIGFITTKQPLPALWLPMTMLNVWRIPLLFFVSGMGVYFALQKRNWKQLLIERTGRILVPFLFGVFFIVPVHMYIWQSHYHMVHDYLPNAGHLWFLGNIFAYVLILSPLFFYLKRNEERRWALWIRKVFSHPMGLVLVIMFFMLETWVIKPVPFELYAMTWHGFFLGLLAFFFGFCFVFSGQGFWSMLLTWRWLFLGAAIVLYAVRQIQSPQYMPGYMMAVESNCWIFAVFGFGYQFLNRPSHVLKYLSQAAYPVYIIHMIFLYLGSWLIFPMDLPPWFQYILVLLFTVVGCFATYELLIRRVNIIRPLFGLKRKSRVVEQVPLSGQAQAVVKG